MSDVDNESEASIQITNIVRDLFSHDSVKTNRILKYYFFQDATFTSPTIKMKGLSNIQYVYTAKRILNRTKPTITNMVFNGDIAVIHMTDHLSLCFLPHFMSLDIPSISILYFKESEQLNVLKIHKQQNIWTIEGLIQSIPLVSYFYTHIFRSIMGKCITVVGDLLDAAYLQADEMTSQGREIQRIGLNMALENMDRLNVYRTELHQNYIQALQNR